MGHQISPTVIDEYVNACVWISSFSFSNLILYFSSSSSSSASSFSSETLNIYLKDLEVEIITACLSLSNLPTQPQSLLPCNESQDQIKLYHSHPHPGVWKKCQRRQQLAPFPNLFPSNSTADIFSRCVLFLEVVKTFKMYQDKLPSRSEDCCFFGFAMHWQGGICTVFRRFLSSI